MSNPVTPVSDKSTRLITAMLAAVITLISWCGTSSSALAQKVQIADDFVWQKDRLTGNESASSRNDGSINYFDVGDLSYYSMYLVQQDLGRISTAAGMTIDRNLKHSSIAIVHDTSVFSRLKNDKKSFSVLGIPDDVIEMLRQRLTDDAKCITMSISDDNNNVILTTILLSEKFDSCLVSGLFGSFGILASEISTKTLTSACALYEGRRMGLRDRQSLSRETPRLVDLCLTRAREIK
jgi:hypothetical protein